MFPLSAQSECRMTPIHQMSSNGFNPDLSQSPVQYRGWLISTKMINGQLWIRWQHPNDTFPRYGRPVVSGDLAATISHVRFLIDVAIKLEANTPRKPS